MIEGWPEEIEAAQKIRTYTIEGEDHPRIPFGSESIAPNPQRRHCRDCSVLIGELHVPGCLVEECPVCGDQANGCGCSQHYTGPLH